MLKVIFFASVCLALLPKCHPLIEPTEIFAWKQLDYTWPTAKDRIESVESGSFVPENNLPLGIEVWKNKLFVAVPRWKLGVASTLNYVSLNEPTEKSPPLTPYPNWELNTLNGNENLEDKFVSVFRVRADECDRLWVLDNGIDDIRGNLTRLTKAKLVIVDLNTDKVIKKILFDESVVRESVFLVNLAVDVDPDECDKAFAYIPDVDGEALIVYSLEKDDVWKIKHNFFHLDPLKGDLTVGGVRFQWPDGVFGVTLSNKNPDRYRTLYFHALCSTSEFSVSTKILRDKTKASDPKNYYEYKFLGDKGVNTQTSDMEFDKNTEVIYLTQLQKDGLACWNTRTPLNSDNVAMIAEDKEKMVFTNDVKIDRDSPNMYIISNKMPQFMYFQLDSASVNFRIFKMNTLEAIKGTPCDVTSSSVKIDL